MVKIPLIIFLGFSSIGKMLRPPVAEVFLSKNIDFVLKL